MLKCKCGNQKFSAHQVLHVSIVVDEENDYLHPESGENEFDCIGGEDIYEANNPFGPYQCTNCGEEYDELCTDLESSPGN